ncbi:hypothetical protein BBJ28_00013020 [Nothophytophthora sp. Chile5]|nr:hypothetical protein BBJ28_00013020 [Nothophytophthora sp. Chile5]
MHVRLPKWSLFAGLPRPLIKRAATFSMGCSVSKSKQQRSSPRASRSDEPNYMDLAGSVDAGGISDQAAHPPRGPIRVESTVDQSFPELEKFRLDKSQLQLTRKVSRGAFGIVYLGRYRGGPVAVKRMVGDEDFEDESTCFSHEIETMSRLGHPKIVRFIGCTWTSKKDLSAVAEYMGMGDVRMLLDMRKVELSWTKEKISIATDIAEALAYMHSQSPKIIHRDIKSRSVLLSNDMVAKVSGSGLSCRTYKEALTAGVGTVRWTAPEVMLGDDYSEQADVYSLGVVLSELDTREIPFEEKSGKTGGGAPDMAIVIKVAKGELRPSFAPDCPDVILRIARACLQFDPALRPDSNSVVQMLNDARVQLQATS